MLKLRSKLNQLDIGLNAYRMSDEAPMNFEEAQSIYKKCKVNVDQCRQNYILAKNTCESIVREMENSLNKDFHQIRLEKANLITDEKEKLLNIAEQEKSKAFDVYVKLGKEKSKQNVVLNEANKNTNRTFKWYFSRGDCLTTKVEVVEVGHKYTVFRHVSYKGGLNLEAMESKWLFDTEQEAVQADADYLYHAKRNIEACIKMAYEEGKFDQEDRSMFVQRLYECITHFNVKDPREATNGNTIN